MIQTAERQKRNHYFPVKIPETQGSAIYTSGRHNYITRFIYDAENKLLKKYLPEAGMIEYIYDDFSRVIMSSDEKSRSNGNWYFTKYDGYGRFTREISFLSQRDEFNSPYQYGPNNPLNGIDPDGASANSALNLIQNNKESILFNALLFDVNPVSIGCIIFQEKYHGFWATLKNGLVFGPAAIGLKDDASLGLAEMQMKNVPNYTNLELPSDRNEIVGALLDDSFAIRLIAMEINEAQNVVGREISPFEACVLHNSGIKGLKHYIDTGKIFKESERIVNRSLDYIFQINLLLQPDDFVGPPNPYE